MSENRITVRRTGSGELRGEISVVIPTLQRAPELRLLVDRLAHHPRVLEVIVINNAPQPIEWSSDRVRVLQQAENIFVNPAWNLGVAEARGRFVAIINDDVAFDLQWLDHAVRKLQSPRVGMVGASSSAFEAPRGRIRTQRMVHRPYGYGTLMVLRKSDYIPIPADGAKVFFGDDWIFTTQKHPNYAIHGIHLQTPMSVTSRDPRFLLRAEAERQWWISVLPQLHGTRYWHRWGPRSGRFRPLLLPMKRLAAWGGSFGRDIRSRLQSGVKSDEDVR